jgi:1,4-alpha-glucan branching enzyme
MGDMKWDMAGAAAVIGAMQCLAARKARAHVVAVIAAVENMPDGNAQRPGDIVTSMSGQTIEVLNTDAEVFGGSGVGNFGKITANLEGSHGQPHSASISVPPLGAVWFKPAK